MAYFQDTLNEDEQQSDELGALKDKPTEDNDLFAPTSVAQGDDDPRVYDLEREFGASEIFATEVIQLQTVHDNVYPATPLLGVVVSGTRAYYLLETLGKGSFGAVYSASSEAIRLPNYTVKQFALNTLARGTVEITDKETWRALGFIPRGADDNDAANDERSKSKRTSRRYYYNKYVEQEYRIGKYIESVLGDICRTLVICPLERIYDQQLQNGYIIYPYFAGISLARYTAIQLSVKMDQIMRSINTDWALGDAVVRRNLRRLAQSNAPNANLARSVVQRINAVHTFVMQIALRLTKAVSQLHAINVVHGDIKPGNIVVDVDYNVRLIDLGGSCATSVDESNDVADAFLLCVDSYTGTAVFADPLTLARRPQQLKAKFKFYSAFDVYSIAKTIQAIATPGLLDSHGKQQNDIIIRDTLFMPEGLHELLVRMTGEDGFKRPSLYDIPKLPLGDVQKRLLKLQNERPTAAQARYEMEGINDKRELNID